MVAKDTRSLLFPSFLIFLCTSTLHLIKWLLLAFLLILYIFFIWGGCMKQLSLSNKEYINNVFLLLTFWINFFFALLRQWTETIDYLLLPCRIPNSYCFSLFFPVFPYWRFLASRDASSIILSQVKWFGRYFVYIFWASDFTWRMFANSKDDPFLYLCSNSVC